MGYILNVLVMTSLCVSFSSANFIEDILNSSCPIQFPNDDEHLSMVDRLTSRGYPSEVHYITTDDGYILTTYRIPFGKKCGEDQPRKIPVLLMHGLFSSSNDWILPDPEFGLAYQLADDCFDVWIGNSRGNFESINHTTLDTKSQQYWAFSWQEMGIHDDPAMINYITETTGQPQINYVGHSQGTTQFFIYATTYPDQALQKVKQFHALAPVAFVSQSSPAWLIASVGLPALRVLNEDLGVYQFLAKSNCTEAALRVCLSPDPVISEVCHQYYYSNFGQDNNEFNVSLATYFLAKVPGGSSLRQLMHYGMCVNSGQFSKYDHGTAGNLQAYGSAVPPDFNLPAYPNVPTWLYYSHEDLLAAETDVLKLIAALAGKLITPVMVNEHEFSHYDYLFGYHATPYIYNPLIAQMNQ